MVTARAEELTEGLFGGVLLFMLETLPELERMGLRPDWRVDAACYGNVVPTVLEPVDVRPGAGPSISLPTLRERCRDAVGGDFEAVGKLWHSRFRPVPSVIHAADAVDPGLDNALGIHYRGGDKLKAAWDTNPMDREDFLDLVEDRLATEAPFERCLVTGDDADFLERAMERLSVPVSSPGVGESHRSSPVDDPHSTRAILAFRDCLLLSRCRAILQTSSALPSFAKVLQPQVDCRRCAASKWFGEVPYFPVAQIPPYRPSADSLRSVVETAMRGDWTEEYEAGRSLTDAAHLPWTLVARPSRRATGLSRLRDRIQRLFSINA